MRHDLYDYPISRKIHDARAALESPAGRTGKQIAEHLMMLEWNGEEDDKRLARDFRRDHALPDQISMNVEETAVAFTDGHTARQNAADRFPSLEPPIPYAPPSRVFRIIAALVRWWRQ